MADRSQGPVDLGALQRRLDEVDALLSGVPDEAARRSVLQARGKTVARARAEARAEGLSVVAFRVGGERYAVPVEAVFQVVEARGLSPLPATPAWLLGAIVSRTRVVPVLDLRALLGLSGGGMSDLGKVVVVEHEGDVFGLAAEELEGRLEVAAEGLSPGEGPFAWIAPDRLALLDLGRIGAGEGRG